jgi:hypothetical protein
MGGSQF